jgi:plastocyanin
MVEGFGGPNAAPAGGSRSATQVLEPGDYVLICVLPGEDGAAHASHGMVLPFTVAAGETEVDADTPTGVEADAEVRLVDFGFGGDTTFGAGDTVHVVNDGDQAHEFVAYKLADGADADAFKAAILGGQGPLPADGGAGLGALAPGRSADVTMPDEPGQYVLFCMLPDTAGDAMPHIAHGMSADATVG